MTPIYASFKCKFDDRSAQTGPPGGGGGHGARVFLFLCMSDNQIILGVLLGMLQSSATALSDYAEGTDRGI